MKKTQLKQTVAKMFFPARPVFQGMDKAPPSPESFKGPEKQSEQDAINEVASQTPSQIFNDTISAGSVIKNQYSQSTTILANLVQVDPIFTGQTGSGGYVPTTKTTNDNNASPASNLPKAA